MISSRHPLTPARRAGRAIAALVILAAIAVAGCGPTTGAPSASATAPAGVASSSAATGREVGVAEAAALRDAGAFVLDVREPDEWAAGHIEGATLIPLGQLPSRLTEVPRDRQVVVVCRTGHRSAQGRDVLLAAGFTDVVSMVGGLNAWTAAGQSVVTGN